MWWREACCDGSLSEIRRGGLASLYKVCGRHSVADQMFQIIAGHDRAQLRLDRNVAVPVLKFQLVMRHEAQLTIHLTSHNSRLVDTVHMLYDSQGIVRLA